MKIQVIEDYTANFEGDVYTIDLSRGFDGFEPGDLICYACPFSACYAAAARTCNSCRRFL